MRDKVSGLRTLIVNRKDKERRPGLEKLQKLSAYISTSRKTWAHKMGREKGMKETSVTGNYKRESKDGRFGDGNHCHCQ